MHISIKVPVKHNPVCSGERDEESTKTFPPDAVFEAISAVFPEKGKPEALKNL